MSKRRKINHQPPLSGSKGKNASAVHLMQFSITWDLMPDPEVEKLPKSVRARMNVLFDRVHKNPKSAIADLRDLSASHPEVPCLKNWLITALRSGIESDRVEALALCEELFRENPDYFFARTTLADIYLDYFRVEEAAELIFGEGPLLTQLYPGRDVFHISEIRHWAFISGRIKVMQGDPDAARGYSKMLNDMEPDSPASHSLDELINGDLGKLASLIAEMKKLGELTQDPKSDH